jgi:hypothetical protein
MTCFSDNVALSYGVGPGAANRALADAAFLGQVMLRRGYLPRGAITIGKLVHTDWIIFGDGLVHAAEAEKSHVITPRIALLEPFDDLMRREFATCPQLKSEFVRDHGDGPFVHILGERWPFLDRERRDRVAQNIAGDPVTEVFEEIRQSLPIRFANAPDDRAREKIQWMRDYVNETIREQNISQHFEVVLSAD